MTQVETVPISVSLPHQKYSHGGLKETVFSPIATHFMGSFPRVTGSVVGSPSTHSSHFQISHKSLSEARANVGHTLFPGAPPLHRGSPNAHLHLGISKAAAMAADGEPDAEKAFFVADLGIVYQQYHRWIKELPEITPFYAVKCNPDPYVLRLLAALGTGFDCASNSEIDAVLALGSNPKAPVVDPTSRIIFANPCKASSFIRSAAARSVHTMTFDNADELHKIKRINPKAQLVLRILTDDSKSLCQLGLKFGASLSSVRPLLELAKSLDLSVIGVAFHVGSGCYDPSVYASSIHLSRVVFNIAASIGFKFRLLDIGGGFEDHLFEKAASVLRDSLEEWFPDRKEMGIKVIAEPGRFFVGKAFKLACCIIARRHVSGMDNHDNEEGIDRTAPIPIQPAAPGSIEPEKEEPQVMYYINDGVYGSFNCTMFDHQIVHPYVLTGTSSQALLIPSSVWGPTCDSIDLVCKSTMLPALDVGDWLGFDNMGAYTVCAASRFNGFDVSRVVYTCGENEEANSVWDLLEAFSARA